MLVKLKAPYCTARLQAPVGQVIEVPNAEAEQLIRGGYAVSTERAKAATPAAAAPAPAADVAPAPAAEVTPTEPAAPAQTHGDDSAHAARVNRRTPNARRP